MRLRHLIVGLALVIAPAVASAQPEAPEGGSEAGESAEAGEGHHGHGDPTKDFNFFDLGYGHKKNSEGEPLSPPFVFALINFGILLVILAKYGAPVGKKMAETRSDQIKSALDEAAKLRKAAQDKLDEYSSKLASAQAEMDAMLTNMRRDAEAEKARILAAAEAQAAAVKKDAEERIAAEIQLARTVLTREVAMAATAAAEQILKDKATKADQTKLVEAFVANVEAAAHGRAGVV